MRQGDQEVFIPFYFDALFSSTEQ